MIIGDQFSILKGYIVFDPQIQTGDNPYVYLTLREKTYKDRQSGKQNYQQVKVLIQGPAVESVVRPRIKKNSFAEFYGRFVIKYATNDAGYEDLNKVESVLFRVEQIGRIEEPRPQNENNQGQQNSQGNSNNNNGGNGNYNNAGNGNYNNGGNGNYNNGGNGNYNNGGNGNYNNGGNGNYNNGGNGNYNNGGNGNYNNGGNGNYNNGGNGNYNNGGGGYQNNNQDPFGGGGGFGGQGNYSQNNQDPFSGDGRPIDISDDDLPF